MGLCMGLRYSHLVGGWAVEVQMTHFHLSKITSFESMELPLCNDMLTADDDKHFSCLIWLGLYHDMDCGTDCTTGLIIFTLSISHFNMED